MAKRSLAAKTEEAVKSVQDSPEFKPLGNLIVDWSRVVSTGSTLLDLSISSSKIYGGGIPGGLLVEIYGKSSSGKTALLCELCGSVQAGGGDTIFFEPVARLDTDYAEIYGAEIKGDNYYQPETVTEMFEKFGEWVPKVTKKDSNPIHIAAADSLAALSTDLEMEKGDKMGMRRAKEFSTELRKRARFINKVGWLFACTNQVRQGEYGDVTPGGNAVEFYASLRIAVMRKEKLYKEKTFNGKKVKRAVGVKSLCRVEKSSIDMPFREAPIYIKFGYGVDDVHGNLQWLKDTLGGTKYKAVNADYQRLDDAIKYIEKNELEGQLRDEVIRTWLEVEKLFKMERKQKQR